MVGRNAVHIDGLLGNASKEVSSSNDDSNLAPKRMYGCNLFGYFVNKDGINTEAPACSQRFS
jgi:hypothetical protein